MPDSLWLLVVGVVVVAVVIITLSPGPLGPMPYYRRGALMSPAERMLFQALQATCGRQYQVFAKVRIADLIAVKKGGTRKARTIALNRIAAKHVDFVLADPVSMRALCAIELDDRSHRRPDRRQRDRFVDRVFAHAGLPLLRVPAAARYDRDALSHAVGRIIGDTSSEQWRAGRSQAAHDRASEVQSHR